MVLRRGSEVERGGRQRGGIEVNILWGSGEVGEEVVAARKDEKGGKIRQGERKDGRQRKSERTRDLGGFW